MKNILEMQLNFTKIYWKCEWISWQTK